MEFFKKPQKKFKILAFKDQRRNLRVLPQIENNKVKSKSRDQQRHALLPGKRISKTGHVYWETRANRSDTKGSKT